MSPDIIWSAAIHRRFPVQRIKMPHNAHTKKSGDESPHSKRQTIA
jgi:hypothetical protein